MASKQCGACPNPIKGQEYLHCLNCNGFYDLICASVSASKFKIMTKDSRKAWVCDGCRNKRPKGDNTNTPLRTNQASSPSSLTSGGTASTNSESQPSSMNITVRKTIKPMDMNDPASKAPNQVDKLPADFRNDLLQFIKDELPTILRDALSSELRGLNTQMVELCDKVNDIKEANEMLRSSVKKCETAITSLRTENTKLTNLCKELETRVTALERDGQQQQQWARLQNLEIVGVPESEGESTVNIVQKIAKNVGVTVKTEDIDFAHRIQPFRSSGGKPRSIVVRFRQRHVKDALYASARKSRDLTTVSLGMGGDSKRVYVNEHLTLNNKKLLQICKAKAKECNVRFVWTKNCRIYTRKNEKSPPVLVLSESDLRKLIS